MKLKRILMMLAMVLFVALSAACDQPTIDTSSDEAFEASLDEMTEGMSEEEEQAFALAILGLTLHYADKYDGDEEAAMDAMDGMSLRDIKREVESLAGE